MASEKKNNVHEKKERRKPHYYIIKLNMHGIWIVFRLLVVGFNPRPQKRSLPLVSNVPPWLGYGMMM